MLLATDKPLAVLALDPGERTGWARADVQPDGSWQDIRQGVHALKDMALALDRNFRDYDLVIYETWRLYPHKAKAMIGNDMQPSQMVGIIRFLGWQYPDVQLVSQGASTKTTADKTMPEWLAERFTHSSEEHDRDALRHLWFWTWKNYPIHKGVAA